MTLDVNMTNYILKNGEPVVEPSLMRWAKWYEKADRHVAQEEITEAGGRIKRKVRISTVFLAVDYGSAEKGKPILWETMVFGGKHHEYQERCSGGRKDAEKMHKRVMKMVQETWKKKAKEKYAENRNERSSDELTHRR